MSLHLQETYVLLSADGVADTLPGGEAFWHLLPEDLAGCGAKWLVSEYVFEVDWPTWEMHPEGDEFIYLLSGEAQMHIEQIGGVAVITLARGAAVIVPRGLWHTAKVSVPCRVLHITRGAGTQTRPI